MRDPAAEIARQLDGLWYLTPFDAPQDLMAYVLRRWPGQTACEARRAAAIFLELRRADYAYRLRTVRTRSLIARAAREVR